MIQSVASQFNQGGPFMWVILAVLGVAGAVVVERFIYYFIICNVNARLVASRLIEALGAGSIDRARALVGKRRTPFFELLRATLETYASGKSPEAIQAGIETVAIRELPKMSQRLNYLTLFANVATLLGLLGTIAGLQVSFGSLASVDAAQKASLLAGGISQAMNTTAFGLIVAVPSMVLYTMLSNKQQALVRDIDESIAGIMNAIKAARS